MIRRPERELIRNAIHVLCYINARTFMTSLITNNTATGDCIRIKCCLLATGILMAVLFQILAAQKLRSHRSSILTPNRHWAQAAPHLQPGLLDNGSSCKYFNPLTVFPVSELKLEMVNFPSSSLSNSTSPPPFQRNNNTPITHDLLYLHVTS